MNAGAKSSTLIFMIQKFNSPFSSANDKAKYEEKALKDKERYEREKAEFIAAGGEMTKAAPAKKSKKSSSSKSPTKSPAKASSSAKSAEFVASSSSDSDSD